MALRGFVLCDDGRLYHPVVAEKAAEAWAARVRNRAKAAKRWDKPKDDPAGAGGDAGADAAALPLDMQGTGTGTVKSSEDKSSGAVAPIDPDKKAWQEGVDLLKSHGVDEKPARQFVGKLVKDSGGEARALLPIIAKCIEIGTQDPRSYLTKAVQSLADRRGGGSPAPPQADEPINWAMRMSFWRKDGTWLGAWGPTPREKGCQCPADLLEAV